MEDVGQEDLVETFQSVTGADVATAQHVLEAHAWDLNRGVEFFLEQSAAPMTRQAGPRTHAVSIDEAEVDDEAVDPTFTLPAPATRLQDDSPAQARPSVPDQHASLLREGKSHDDALQRALAESAREAELASGEDHSDRAGEDAPTLLDTSDDDDIDIIGVSPCRHTNRVPTDAPSTATANGRPSADGTAGKLTVSLPCTMSGGLWGEDEGVQRRQRRSRPRGAAAGLYQDLRELQALGQHVRVPGASVGPLVDPLEELMGGSARTRAWPHPMSAAAAEAAAASADPVLENGRLASEDLQLPDGINVEEARMLEAAMLGVPYVARPSARNEAWTPPAPPAPEVIAQRQIRDEQDAAYQESLLADMEKAQQASRAQQEAKQAERANRDEQEAAEQQQRDYERLISSKQASMPAEAPAEHSDTVSIMVRLPNGTRASRRFARSQSLETLFDWVDVTVAPDIKPGTYSLVTQFPRRQLQPQTAGSLQEAGLTEKQEALFLNVI